MRGAADTVGSTIVLPAGLQTSFWRLDAAISDGQFRWLTVDLPPVIDLRARLLPESSRMSTCAQSALDSLRTHARCVQMQQAPAGVLGKEMAVEDRRAPRSRRPLSVPLQVTGRRRDACRLADCGVLLDNMRQLVRDQVASGRGSSGVLVLTEHDRPPDRVGTGPEPRGRCRRVRVGMHTDVAEVPAKAGRELAAHTRLELLAGTRHGGSHTVVDGTLRSCWARPWRRRDRWPRGLQCALLVNAHPLTPCESPRSLVPPTTWKLPACNRIEH